jgi:hypothetical protein
MTTMSFADSMNSLDAMNDHDVAINEIRPPSIKVIFAKIASLFQPGQRLQGPANRQQQHFQQS